MTVRIYDTNFCYGSHHVTAKINHISSIGKLKTLNKQTSYNKEETLWCFNQ